MRWLTHGTTLTLNYGDVSDSKTFPIFISLIFNWSHSNGDVMTAMSHRVFAYILFISSFLFCAACSNNFPTSDGLASHILCSLSENFPWQGWCVNNVSNKSRAYALGDEERFEKIFWHHQWMTQYYSQNSSFSFLQTTFFIRQACNNILHGDIV